MIKDKLKEIFPEALLPEEYIHGFSGPETVMASTKFLSCALANDSGVSHMLSTNFCPLIKLFGPKSSEKFTPISNQIYTISAQEFGSNRIDQVKLETVIDKIESIIN